MAFSPGLQQVSLTHICVFSLRISCQPRPRFSEHWGRQATHSVFLFPFRPLLSSKQLSPQKEEAICLGGDCPFRFTNSALPRMKVHLCLINNSIKFIFQCRVSSDLGKLVLMSSGVLYSLPIFLWLRAHWSFCSWPVCDSSRALISYCRLSVPTTGLPGKTVCLSLRGDPEVPSAAGSDLDTLAVFPSIPLLPLIFLTCVPYSPRGMHVHVCVQVVPDACGDQG